MDETTTVTAARCADEKGQLPACAPLAVPFVPFQQQNPQVYTAGKGFVRGTLFPGLDLPFQNQINQNEKTATLSSQLQAMSFAIDELGLYLDTHRDDADAVALFNQYVERYADAMQKYEAQYDSLTQRDSALEGTYTWIDDPWPWDYLGKEPR